MTVYVSPKDTRDFRKEEQPVQYGCETSRNQLLSEVETFLSNKTSYVDNPSNRTPLRQVVDLFFDEFPQIRGATLRGFEFTFDYDCDGLSGRDKQNWNQFYSTCTVSFPSKEIIPDSSGWVSNPYFQSENPGASLIENDIKTTKHCCCYVNQILVMSADKIEWRNEYYFPDVPCTHKPEGTYQRKFVNGKATNQLRNHTTNFRVTERGDFENRFTTYETRIFSKKRTCTVTTRYQIKFIEYWVNDVKLCEIKQDVGVISVTDSCRTNSSGGGSSGDSDAHSGGQRYGDVDGVLTDLETGEPVFGGGNSESSGGGGGSGAGSDAGGNDYGDPSNW